MNKPQFRLLLLGAALLLILAATTGCGKRATVLPPAQTPAQEKSETPPPTIQFRAMPATVDPGGSTTLSWTTTNSTEVTIEGVGSFPPNGSTVVRPEQSTTYSAVAKGPGGSQTAQYRVTVAPSTAGTGTDTGSGRDRAGTEMTNLSEEEIFNTQIKDVFFEFDRADILPEAREILKMNAEILAKRIPKAQILIEGHCDERGSEEYNLALGDRRAYSVKEFLMEHGVDGSRIRTISYGNERPFDPAHTEEAYAKNRRAHFVLAK